LKRFLRHDGVFLLRLMTLSSNALTTVDLTGALWNNYWKLHGPPTSDVTLTGGAADQSTMLFNGRRHASDVQSDDSTVKRKRARDDLHYEPLTGTDTGTVTGKA